MKHDALMAPFKWLASKTCCGGHGTLGAFHTLLGASLAPTALPPCGSFLMSFHSAYLQWAVYRIFILNGTHLQNVFRNNQKKNIT